MNTTHWIICERSARWAPALRMMLSVSGIQHANSATLHEVRGIVELNDRLKAYPRSLVLLEVTQENTEAALTWLAATTSREKHTLAIVLLDFYRIDGPDRPLTIKLGQPCMSHDRDIVAAALREAGAMDVIYSPRQTRPVLAMGQRHAARCNMAASDHPDSSQSFENWAWSLLPWQDAG